MGRIGKLAVAVALSVGSLSAFADPCPALDYAEMKDMSTEQLTGEWCQDTATENDLTRQIFNIAMGASGDQHALGAGADRCRAEKRRIERIISQKDSALDSKALAVICRKAGKI